ncbi:MAG: restriction endonuclease subunit S [Lactobacillus kalixensis]|uniref:restriction endonuclease subunit S n=1 Tax=Lactobacillus kalixensis TaxID=227944 RepID=UPI0039919BF4
MSKDKKRLVPVRRFKEFENSAAWEQRRLGEVAKITMGQSPSSRNYTENPSDYILVQGNADMKNGHVVPRVWTTQITKQAEKGDLILSVRAPVGDIGKTDYDIVIGRGVAAIKGNSFIFQLLTKMKLNGYWTRFSTGSTFESINSDNIKNAQIMIPNLKEQEKIGNTFSSIDSLITLHQRKLDKLKRVKSAYLTELFPAEGEREPKRRFPGFTGAWEQRKLGEILSDLYNGQTPSRNVKSYWKGDIPWLTSGELNHGIVEETIEKISESGKKAANLRLIPSGTIVIAITGLEAPGTRGNCAILGIDTTVNQSVMALVVKNNIDTQFVFQWYKKIGEEYGIRYTQGTKQQSYNYDLVKILPITIPTTTEEQQKIGSFFNQLDSLIALHQRKLDKLKKMKAAYLNEMFV